MSRQSRIEALRRLAERPGTEHEGSVAREMLKRLESATSTAIHDDEANAFDAYRAYLRREMTVDAFVEALARFAGERWNCPFGASVASNKQCDDWRKHLEIQTDIRHRFKRGDRVLYNYHAYPADCPGKVVAYVPLKPENGTYPWAWISIKFDHLKSARQVPILSSEGWHMKHAVTEMVEV